MAAPSYPLGHKQKNAPAQVLQKAQEMGVALSLVNGKLNAAGDRESVQVLAPLLRQHRDELVGLLTEAANDPAPPRPAPATPPAPRSWLHLDAAWRRLDALYLAHHWQCPACRTAGAGRGARCEVGQRLHDQLAQAIRAA